MRSKLPPKEDTLVALLGGAALGFDWVGKLALKDEASSAAARAMGVLPLEPLEGGALVLTSGVLELKARLDELRAGGE